MTHIGFKNQVSLATLVAGLSLCICFFSIISIFSFDERLYLKILPEQSQAKDIVVIKIDAKSLEKMGAWPWTRQKHSEIISKILENKPKKLGIDIVYQYKPEEVEDSLKLNAVLQDPKVVAGYIKTAGVKPDPVIYQGVNIATVEVPIEPDGFLHKVNSNIDGLDSLSKKISGEQILPNSYLINTKTNLPNSISLVDFLDNKALQNFIQDKYVFLGSTSPNLGDIYQFPELGANPGVYIHALSLQQILEKHLYNQKKINFLELFSYSIFFSVLASFVVKKEKYLTLGLPLMILLTSLLFLPWIFEYISLALILSFLLASFLLFSWGSLESSSRQKRRLFRILKSYLSPQHLSKVLLTTKNLNLGGEKYNCTLMFTDIRSFTTISEKLDPEDVGNLLNTILGFQAEIILKNEGVVDKFIGDAVMAFWGAPIPTTNHAFLALQTAGDLVVKLDQINQEREDKICIGVGLDSGDVVVGNFGSSKRLNYTALGDTVNTASRVEHMCKEYFGQVLLTSKSYNQLTEEQKQYFQFELVDKIKPRGKTEYITLYELVAYRKEISDEFVNLTKQPSKNYLKALELYFDSKYKQAEKLFISENTPRSLYLAQRCQILLADE
ncbi:MAG: adenylate/guanylate cyclase domain-containing protein [bacterium]